MSYRSCRARGGYANWDCVLDEHEGEHVDALGRTFEAVTWKPVIDARRISVRDAEKILDRHEDYGIVVIDGIKVAFSCDPFDYEEIWFYNPGDDIDDEHDPRIIAKFVVEKTVVRA